MEFTGGLTAGPVLYEIEFCWYNSMEIYRNDRMIYGGLSERKKKKNGDFVGNLHESLPSQRGNDSCKFPTKKPFPPPTFLH